MLASYPGVALAQPRLAGSQWRPPEAILFTCRVGTKMVSIWAQQQRSGAVYRYGHSGRIEIETPDLHFAQHAFRSGGETHVYADTPTHRYVVYDRMSGPGSTTRGTSDPKCRRVVQSGGPTLSSQDCAQSAGLLPPAFDQRLLEKLVPEGEFVPH